MIKDDSATVKVKTSEPPVSPVAHLQLRYCTNSKCGRPIARAVFVIPPAIADAVTVGVEVICRSCGKRNFIDS